MKKTLLIVATILLSITSSYAYSVELAGAGKSAVYKPNTKYVSYTIEVTRGAGTSVVSANFSQGGYYFESVRSTDNTTNLISGYINAPGVSYISSLYLETICFTGETGYPTAKAWW